MATKYENLQKAMVKFKTRLTKNTLLELENNRLGLELTGAVGY